MICVKGISKRLLTFVLVGSFPFLAFAQPPVADSPAIEARARQMLSRLTLSEKIDLIGGDDFMFIRAEPAAGFPRLKMSDGPYGVRTFGPDAAYVAGVGLAATWDPDLAKRVGASIGEDARARGVHFLLGPGVNIYRSPLNGRNFEYFGEDPFLTSRLTVGYIEGVQSKGVVATVKHLAGNDQEWDRHNSSSDIDERTLREIYLPAFEAAVKEAHVGAVMDSYNLVNGVHSTQNSHLNLDILKQDWKFDGILMSDWDSTYDGVAAANNGLDLEMPSAKFMNAKTLQAAVEKGTVSEKTIDDKVLRIFRTAIRFGFLEREQLDPGIPADNPAARATSLQAARESLVLLKNDGNILPFGKEIHSIAVIGTNAWPAVTGGGGSSIVTPFSAVSPLQGISNRAGAGAKVLYARGLPGIWDLYSRTAFIKTSEEKPVKIQVFDNRVFSGDSTTSFADRIEPWRLGSKSATTKSIRYTASFKPTSTGQYLFLVDGHDRDAYTLLVNGSNVLTQETREGSAPHSVEVSLEAGKPANIQLDYLPGGDDPRVALGIRAVSQLISAEALQLASNCDAVVLSIGFDPSTESEGFDRTYKLPFGQDDLIQAIAAVNKKVVVVVNAGGEFDVHAWLKSVPALITTFYPGEEGGNALAEILFGDRSPEGKLPFTFVGSWEQNPVYKNYYAEVPSAAISHINYKEGVFVGYRSYNPSGPGPLYPFGYGLSYSTFKFDHLKVSASKVSGEQTVAVSFEVTNTGSRAGAEVAQVYVGDPSAKIARPAKELKAFQKVYLEPGQSKQVQLSLDSRALSYWDVTSGRWKIDPGVFRVIVGNSSGNDALDACVQITQ